jgi:hypothetical protein
MKWKQDKCSVSVWEGKEQSGKFGNNEQKEGLFWRKNMQSIYRHTHGGVTSWNLFTYVFFPKQHADNLFSFRATRGYLASSLVQIWSAKTLQTW